MGLAQLVAPRCARMTRGKTRGCENLGDCRRVNTEGFPGRRLEPGPRPRRNRARDTPRLPTFDCEGAEAEGGEERLCGNPLNANGQEDSGQRVPEVSPSTTNQPLAGRLDPESEAHRPTHHTQGRVGRGKSGEAARASAALANATAPRALRLHGDSNFKSRLLKISKTKYE